MDFAVPERPRVRPVEVVPFAEGGRKTFLVHDPSGHLDAPLQLSPAALLLLSLCDGSRTQEAIRGDYAQRTGQPLGAEQLGAFLSTMDQALLFKSERFEVHKSRIQAEFAAAPWRAAAHAGAAYEGDATKLAPQLDRWLAAGDAGARADGRLRALIAPHIDFHRGGAGYGKSYAALLRREPPEVVVVFGTGHSADEGRFILCPKGFETPRGRLAADADFLGRLERRLPMSYRRGELAHRGEHSIEFQALWLAHLFGGAPPTLVPILCTSFDDLMEQGKTPHEDAETSDFLDALQETWREETRRVLVVVGADLSHVGPRFGDPDVLTPEFLEQVRVSDHRALDGIQRGAAYGFFAAVAEHRNRHRICSVASIYAAMHMVGANGGDLLVYDQAVDPQGNLAVTFAGLALYGPDGGKGLGRVDGGKRVLKQGKRV